MKLPIVDEKPFAVPEFLTGGGEMGQRIREYDWSKTSLGPINSWPQSLRTCIRIMLTSRQPIWIGWGKELIKFYNDPYKAIVGGKHPWALGTPASIVWKDIWKDIEPMLKQVMEEDEGTYVESQLLIMERNGYPEETYYTFSYTPIPGDDGKTEGMFCANTDDTDKIISERQLKTLTQLGKKLADCQSSKDVIDKTIETLAENPFDFSFAIFRTMAEGKAVFSNSTPLGQSAHLIKKEIDINADNPVASTIRNAFTSLTPQVLEDAVKKVGELPKGAWPVSPDKLMVLPIVQSGTNEPYGILVIGLNPYRLLDEKYMGFFSLVADQVATSFADIHVLEEERKRAAALAEIDRAKTTFFSNISHEFRTPLTLLLGPIEDALNDPATIPENKIRMNVAYRNALRMQKLVNTLLEFSRIEAGRVEGKFRKVNICTITQDLASTFRSAIEKAGMQLLFECKEIKDEVYVDVDMWEKIVLNLVSNAFKYSKEGKITVKIIKENDEVRLSVSDTGVGIPTDQLEKIFDRFHRIENIQGRSQEGTGIGLAMVKELVRLHQGNILVESEMGKGSTFTVSLPTGKDHLPADKMVTDENSFSISNYGNAFVQEAMKWLPGEVEMSGDIINDLSPSDIMANGTKTKIVLADDNADMRDYVYRLLSNRFEVITAIDGEDAFKKILRHKPELLISDVMMPKLDGFGLLQKLKAHIETKSLPIIFLSARAGEEAKVEGLDAGADDYLVKPFSARELLAKVSSQIRINQLRNKALQDVYNMFDEVPFAVAVLKGESLTIEFINKYNLSIWRRRKEEVLGKPLFEVFPGNAKGARPIHDKVYATGERCLITEVPLELNRDGKEELHYFNALIDPLKNERGDIIGQIATSIDVTDFVLARRKIEESESYFRRMADSVPATIWITEKDGSCSYLNKQWYEMTGQNEEEAIGFGWLKATHPEDAERAGEIFLEANQKQVPFSILYRLRQKNGEYRWAIDSGKPRFNDKGDFLGFIGSVIDVHEEKEASQKLLISENRYRHIFEGTPVSIWEEDFSIVKKEIEQLQSSGVKDVKAYYTSHPDKLNHLIQNVSIKDVNAVTLQLLEASSKEEIKEGLQHIFVEDTTEAFIRELEMIADGGGQFKYETVLRTLKGKQIEVLVHIDFPRSDDYSSILVSLADISQRKKAEKTVRESEERFRLMADASPVMIWTLDAEGNSTYYNKRATDFTGHTQEELKDGKSWKTAIHPDDLDHTAAVVGYAVQNRQPYQMECRMKRADGEWRWLLSHGTPRFGYNDEYLGFVGSSIDITERKVAEEQIKESETKFRSLAETLPQLVWMTNEKGEQEFASSRWKEYTGIEPTGPGTWQHIVHPEDMPSITKAWANSIETGSLYKTEARLKNKMNEYRWHFVQGEPIRNDNGKITKWMGAFTDIHEQKQFAEELEKLVTERTRALQQSNEDLQQFAHVASHDLKEPLRKIKTFSSRLTSDEHSVFSDTAQAYFNKINSAADRMNSMIEGVLNYSILNASEQIIKPVDLNETILQIQTDLELLIDRRSAKFIYNNLPNVEGASVLIYQLFYNLINNSLKFSKPDTETIIAITSSVIKKDQKEFAEITLRDNGIGFEQEFAEKIFETFSRLNSKDQFEGTGLGLSLCKRIAERHGGSINAFGEPDTGASFVVLLPVKQEKKRI